MQAKKFNEHELVKICMAELCHKAGFVDHEAMVQRDLVFLCDRIEVETGVLISLSTIKRLLKGQFSRIPQVATLDAIANSAGYENWQSFKLNKGAGNGSRLQAGAISGVANEPAKGNSYKLSVTKFIAFGCLVFLTIMGVIAIIKFEKRGIGNADKAQFSAVKVTGNDVPNTVVFKYNVDSVEADSFFIQQSWDRNRRVKIQKHSYTLTDIYYEPGYHTAKLIANNKIIKKLYVSIPTDRWFFYAKERAPKSIPKYILSTNGIKDGAMQLTLTDILKGKIDIQKQNEFIQVYYNTP
jgi:hypothetical protein